MHIVKYDSLTHWKLVFFHMLSLWIKQIINMMDGLFSWKFTLIKCLLLSVWPPDSAPFVSSLFPPSAIVFQVLSFCVEQVHSIGACFSLCTVDKYDVLPWSVSPSPEPCVLESVSKRVCVCAQHWSWFSQSDGKAKWLIGARQSDLIQGEHSQSYSSRSNSSSIIEALEYELSCTGCHAWEDRRSWGDGLMLRFTWMSQIRKRLFETKHYIVEVLTMFEWDMTCVLRAVNSYNFSCLKTAIGKCSLFIPISRDKNGQAFSSLFALQFPLSFSSLPHHINSPFLLSSTRFNPSKRA